jgi:ribonuclease III
MCSDEAVIWEDQMEYFGELEAILGYKFTETAHLLNALTRRSFWHENRETCVGHNERLEFLGDAVLGLVTATVLYREFPEDEEGELQKKRASLVNKASLAYLTRDLGLARFIRMGRGDEISGCRDRDSVLADTLEAILAAVYLDGGLLPAHQVIERLFCPLIERCATRQGIDDCKSLLQERAQAQLGITPTYRVIDQWGAEHQKTFSVAVYLGDQVAGTGTGRNKREAAQNAARQALSQL